jgi:protein-tyrosine phosphatase
MSPLSVTFVCTGNICRSPMGEVVLRALAERDGLGDLLAASSAGTGDWHVGEPADPRTIEALRARGYDGRRHRAKQFEASGLARHDLVVAFDRGHERVLRAWAADEAERSRVRLLLSFDPAAGALDVPDPYYSDAAAFDAVLTQVERATTALYRQIRPALRGGPP